MDGRRLLVWSSIGAAAALTVILYFVPWIFGLVRVNREIEELEGQVEAARAIVEQRRQVETEWKAVEARLDRARGTETPLNEFMMELNAVALLVGLDKWSAQQGRDQKLGERGEFTEYSVETSFQAGWEAFVRLLLELRNWEGPLRVQRMVATSRYEQANHLDVTLKVSTIELTPGRAGGKP